MQNYERNLKISSSKWKYYPLPSQSYVKSGQKVLMRTWHVLDRAEQHSWGRTVLLACLSLPGNAELQDKSQLTQLGDPACN